MSAACRLVEKAGAAEATGLLHGQKSQQSAAAVGFVHLVSQLWKVLWKVEVFLGRVKRCIHPLAGGCAMGLRAFLRPRSRQRLADAFASVELAQGLVVELVATSCLSRRTECREPRPAARRAYKFLVRELLSLAVLHQTPKIKASRQQDGAGAPKAKQSVKLLDNAAVSGTLNYPTQPDVPLESMAPGSAT